MFLDAGSFFLLVELVFLLVLLDDGLVRLFKVFCKDDISVLTYCQHASLVKEKELKINYIHIFE